MYLKTNEKTKLKAEHYKNNATQKNTSGSGCSIHSNIFNGQKCQGKQHQKGTFYIDKHNHFSRC